MATYSSVLVWRIPWTEELGGLQSMGSQRVRHDRVTKHTSVWLWGFQVALVVKNPPANAGDVRSSPGGGNGNPLQYSCLENPMDRGAWRATVHRVTELDMTEAN